ncbi:hypothetical protein PENSUB_4611 [Penicillium subrubescens]|uniref:Uncharacterized protein n=1 Tax=Penicillium subrubescens TaxID=1316194 RepID=A0A1Q5UBZ9_9EURO|nr:hypothetical protein PENSUB_4611 [Penicillium subrubescens]
MPSSKIPSNVGECVEKNTLQTEPGYHENQSSGGNPFFFGISSSYIQDWDVVAAFRELYQNWSVLCCHLERNAQRLSLFTNRRDAILARFSLGRLDFQPV